MEEKIKGILDAFRSFELSESETIDRLAEMINSKECTCSKKETTGWTTFKCCNICGRIKWNIPK